MSCRHCEKETRRACDMCGDEVVIKPSASEPEANSNDLLWLPIETAPKTVVPIWLADSNNKRLGYWSGWKDDPEKVTGRCWIDLAKAEGREAVTGLSFSPTHWQPTPELP